MTSNLNISFDDLYDSCLFSSLLHAISNLKLPFGAYSQSWDGMNFSFQDGTAYGTVSFDFENRIAAGAMRENHSPRRYLYPAFDSIELFAQAPEAVRDLAVNGALMYLFEEIGGITKPVATTAMWCHDNQTTVYNDCDDFYDNGGEFIRTILVPKDELRDNWIREFWEANYEFSPQEVELAYRLFELAKNRAFDLADDLIAFVGRNEEGFNEFIEALEQVGFRLGIERNPTKKPKSKAGAGQITGAYGETSTKPVAFGEGSEFSPTQVNTVLTENMRRNNGEIRDDQTGKILLGPRRLARGVPAPLNVAQVDHVTSGLFGSPSSFSNAQVIGASEKLAKDVFDMLNAIGYTPHDQDGITSGVYDFLAGKFSPATAASIRDGLPVGTGSLEFGFDALYDSCLFSSLLHAIANLRYPLASHTQSWDGTSYSFQGDITRGTVSFDFGSRIASGAMRSNLSPRILLYPDFEPLGLFLDAPEDVKALAASQALPYLFESIGKAKTPVATTAIWCRDDQTTVCGDYDDFYGNGGELLCDILKPVDKLRDYWNEEYGFSPQELELADRLFELAKNRMFDVADDLLAFVESNALGLNEFIDSLNEIGFRLPIKRKREPKAKGLGLAQILRGIWRRNRG